MPLIYDHKLVLVDMIVQRTCNHDGKWGEEKHFDSYDTADNSFTLLPLSHIFHFFTSPRNFVYLREMSLFGLRIPPSTPFHSPPLP